MKTLGCLITAAAVMTSGCKKPEKPAPAAAEAVAPVQQPLPIASHLGIATKVPADADLFVAGYGAGETFMDLFEPVLTAAGDGKDSAGFAAKSKEFTDVVGDEAFLFVGPGLGLQLETVGTSYRGLSAAWAEFAAGKVTCAVAR